MQTLDTDVVVIGGGATGAGVVRDCAMRGFSTVLLERADIGQGTSARYHGLLHSGGRYVISDPESATQCAEENAIVKRINADAVEDTGGMFVLTPNDPEDFADRFLPAALETGVACEEITVGQARREEPRLNPATKRVFRVQDGAVDGWRLIWGALESAKEYGADIRPYHRVTDIEVRDSRVQAVTARNEKTGEDIRFGCRFVINCAGPWAGDIATMIGAQDVAVVPGRGIMIGFNQRLVHHVINRCAVPADGDILVPAHPICIIGTTDQAAKNPDLLRIKPAEVQKMLDKGADMVPVIRQARALHVWAGARPLLKDTRVAATDTRHMSRGMAIMDHEVRDGVSGMVTIAGGKFTTYRLMAQEVVNAMCNQLKDRRPCRTAEEPVPSGSDKKFSLLTDRLKDREADRHDVPIICECELVNKQMIEATLKEDPASNLDDIRRKLRVGMGPCQGTFCASRTAGILHQFRCQNHPDKDQADVSSTMLRLFLSNRQQGNLPIMYGQMLEEIALNQWVVGTLDLHHLPAPSPQAKLATGDLALNHGTAHRDPLGEETATSLALEVDESGFVTVPSSTPTLEGAAK